MVRWIGEVKRVSQDKSNQTLRPILCQSAVVRRFAKDLSMAKITNAKSSGAGDTLQKAVEDSLATIPVIFLEHQISKKLKQ